MKTAFSLILAVGLSSCGPLIDARRGIVSTGFLSKTQAFAGKLTTPDGATATWSVVNHDGTTVASSALNTITAVKAAEAATKALQSSNALKASQTPPTVLTNKAADGTVTQTPVFNPLLNSANQNPLPAIIGKVPK